MVHRIAWKVPRRETQFEVGFGVRGSIVTVIEDHSLRYGSQATDMGGSDRLVREVGPTLLLGVGRAGQNRTYLTGGVASLFRQDEQRDWWNDYKGRPAGENLRGSEPQVWRFSLRIHRDV